MRPEPTGDWETLVDVGCWMLDEDDEDDDDGAILLSFFWMASFQVLCLLFGAQINNRG